MDEDLKRCCKFKTFSSKSNFFQAITKKDGYRPSCKICCQKSYYINQNRILNQHKNYNKKNRSKINAYEGQRRKTDFNFKLICNIRRINLAFKSQNVRKTNKTIDLIGCSQNFLGKWTLHQLYGDITEENYGKMWCLDHCYPLSKTNLSDNNEVNKSTNWINLRPMYCSKNISKGDKIDHRLYLIQEIKAYQFINLNDQGRLN